MTTTETETNTTSIQPSKEENNVEWRECEVHIHSLPKSNNDIMDNKSEDGHGHGHEYDHTNDHELEEQQHDFIFNLFETEEDEPEVMEFELGNGIPCIQLACFDRITNSTGLGVWGGAECMSKFLIENPQNITNKNVLELGAGTGLCGLVSYHLGASHITLTDGDSQVLRNLRENIRRNIETDTTIDTTTNTTTTITATTNSFGNRKIVCPQLIWGKDLDRFVNQYGPQDVILSSDCCYMPAALEPFWKTVDALLSKDNGVVIYVMVSASQVSEKALLNKPLEYGFQQEYCSDSQDVIIFKRKHRDDYR
mmetsp:Transcript_12010/g.13955  ORF Transcript_12010/g.13955 Transcript_12010/m.13955 type:complete len:309 (-) Transcript_12010:654-1580(-)